MDPSPPPLAEVAARLHRFALGLPEAWEDHPWGDTVVKVGKKIFVFLGEASGESTTYGLCVKLPESAEQALMLPGAKPAGYGLGKAGWVDIRVTEAGSVPVEVLCDWVDESYRAVAPKRLVRQLDSVPPP